MLKVPDHQVAGHQALNGMLGPLIDNSGNFYKPLQSGERGTKEVEFYTSFSSNAKIPDNIRKFFPIYYGTKLIEASDGSGLFPHLVLQDIVSCYLNPTLMDIKIGSRTWYLQASEDYIQKCLKKDRESSSLPLGFRISGFQIYQTEVSGYWKPDRKSIQKLTADEVKLVLRNFVSSNSAENSDTEPDCSFAPNVYGGGSGILALLLELKKWFEEQTFFHFYSCSVLMVYEKESLLEGKSPCPAVKLVDFAHVVDGEGVIDHNFLGGLCSLIKFISDIVLA
ncbi:hypothetical protein UlMin_006369 [Ulmus minor]